MINKQHSVLAVDLDHTLINTDFILEGIKFLISKKIYALPKLFFILIFNGKTYAKKYLYDNTNIEISSLPFNIGVINFIHQNKINYEHVILISGSYYRYVESVADYLGLFDSFSGTTTTVNMISFNKIKYLNCKSGDVVLFDWKLIHGSSHNISSNSRKIILYQISSKKNYDEEKTHFICLYS